VEIRKINRTGLADDGTGLSHGDSRQQEQGNTRDHAGEYRSFRRKNNGQSRRSHQQFALKTELTTETG
jgi:hypothetical protein